jgi:hypothetical protein
MSASMVIMYLHLAFNHTMGISPLSRLEDIGKDLRPAGSALYERNTRIHVSLMYLASAQGVPTPSSEVKGLLLLTSEEIHRLYQEQLTWSNI